MTILLQQPSTVGQLERAAIVAVTVTAVTCGLLLLGPSWWALALAPWAALVSAATDRLVRSAARPLLTGRRSGRRRGGDHRAGTGERLAILVHWLCYLGFLWWILSPPQMIMFVAVHQLLFEALRRIRRDTP